MEHLFVGSQRTRWWHFPASYWNHHLLSYRNDSRRMGPTDPFHNVPIYQTAKHKSNNGKRSYSDCARAGKGIMQIINSSYIYKCLSNIYFFLVIIPFLIRNIDRWLWWRINNSFGWSISFILFCNDINSKNNDGKEISSSNGKLNVARSSSLKDKGRGESVN